MKKNTTVKRGGYRYGKKGLRKSTPGQVTISKSRSRNRSRNRPRSRSRNTSRNRSRNRRRKLSN